MQAVSNFGDRGDERRYEDLDRREGRLDRYGDPGGRIPEPRSDTESWQGGRYAALADLNEGDAGYDNRISREPGRRSAEPRSADPRPPADPRGGDMRASEARRGNPGRGDVPTGPVPAMPDQPGFPDPRRVAQNDGDGIYRTRRPAIGAVLVGLAVIAEVLVARLLLNGIFGPEINASHAISGLFSMIGIPLFTTGLYALMTGAASPVTQLGPRIWLRPPLIYVLVGAALFLAAGMAA